MKILGLIILVQFTCTLYGQDLRNTEWVKIKAERKDGSKIVDHSGLDKGAFVFIFEESSVSILSGGQYSYEQNFSIKDGVLTIGRFQSYSIDTVNSMTLVLTERHVEQQTDDKINRFTFINRRFHLSYLIQNKQITLISDTLIQCNNEFFPIHNKGDLGQIFMDEFNPVKINTILVGNFIMTPSGEIMSIQVMPNEKLSKKDTDKFVETLKQTSGHWTLPKGTSSLHFKIDFICRFMNKPPLWNISFMFHTQDPNRFDLTGLTLQQRSEADQHFNKGLRLSNHDKHDKALTEFTKCINIDSLYIDAYYNKAYSYLKLGDKKSACDTWRQLSSMGQNLSIQLYRENCN